MAAPVTQLRPPADRQADPAPINRWTRKRIIGYTPAALAATIAQLERGECEAWADVAEYMLRTDAHTRSVYGTLLQSVAAAEIRWEPSDEDDELAQAAAEFVAEAWSKVRSAERTVLHLLHGEGVGWSAAEHEWDRVKTSRGYAWLSTKQHPVAARDFKFDVDWVPIVRSWERTREEVDTADERSGSLPGVSLREHWYRVDKEPARWLVHVPGGIGTSPQLSGLLLAVAWPWLFKHWNTAFRQQAMEKFGSPTPIGKVGENDDEDAVRELKAALEGLAVGHALVLRSQQSVDFVQASDRAGEAFALSITHLENEISKGLLGSTLNVDVQATGSRAVADSQHDTTILPRLQAIGGRLEETLENAFAAHTLRFNAHLFGGRVPPMPRCKVVLEAEEPPAIQQMHIDAGIIRVNQLLESAGLPPLSEDEGGNAFVKPQVAPSGGDQGGGEATPQGPGEDPDGPPGEDLEERKAQVESTLNGAQVQALQTIVQGVADGSLPRDAAQEILEIAFPITPERVSKLLDGADSFTPRIKPGDEEVGKPPAPLRRRQLGLPLMTPRTSPTSSDSRTRTSAVPFPPSEGPAKSS